MIQKSWKDLIPHSIAGVILTGLFWAICAFLNEPVAGSILVVPALFLATFLFTVWLVKRAQPAAGCCEGPVRLKGVAVLVPKPGSQCGPVHAPAAPVTPTPDAKDAAKGGTKCLDTNLNSVIYR